MVLIHRAAIAAAAGVIAVLAMTGAAPLAQHSYTPEQVQAGKALYDANCGRCHNDDGAGVTGIELFRQIRRASSDEEIARLIQNGIPGTSMPPHQFSTEQALNVVAFMRSMVGVKPGSLPAAAAAGDAVGPLPPGDATRGKAVFAGKGGCLSCHRAEGQGGTSGPDLSAAGAGRGGGPFRVPADPVALARSILDPDASIAAGYQMFQATPKGGAAVRGTLLNQDTFSVQLRDGSQNLRAFLKSDLADFGFLPSPMPSYRGRLTAQEVSDVVSYLLTLKGQPR
jgi:putative heme-binding domain-containing protein